MANDKLREALVKIYHEVRSYCPDFGAGESHESLVDRAVNDPPDYTSYRDSILEIDRIVEAALAAPPRNYEVGTVEEQAKRFAEYCESEVCKRKRCKSRAKALCIERCALEWAQMPYVEKEGGTK